MLSNTVPFNVKWTALCVLLSVRTDKYHSAYFDKVFSALSFNFIFKMPGADLYEVFHHAKVIGAQ